VLPQRSWIRKDVAALLACSRVWVRSLAILHWGRGSWGIGRKVIVRCFPFILRFFFYDRSFGTCNWRRFWGHWSAMTMHVAHMFLERLLASELFATKLARNSLRSTSAFVGSKLKKNWIWKSPKNIFVKSRMSTTYVFDMLREDTAIAADSLTILGARTGRWFRWLTRGWKLDLELARGED
jgi:hypothetical protein